MSGREKFRNAPAAGESSKSDDLCPTPGCQYFFTTKDDHLVSIAVEIPSVAVPNGGEFRRTRVVEDELHDAIASVLAAHWTAGGEQG